MTHAVPSPELPAGIRCAADYARLAPDHLSEALWTHLDGGSGHDLSAKANLAAFADIAIVPRILRPVSDGHTRVTICGVERPHPIMLAPVASLALVHPDAERAVAAASAATRTCFVASTMSSLSLEDIAAAAAPPDRWFQLYIQPDREATLDLVRRAEAAAYQAIVVTVDTPIQLPSFRALDAGFVPPTEAPNLAPYAKLDPSRNPVGGSGILARFMAGAPVFSDVEWLLENTRLPLWIKGVMHEHDALQLARLGVAGVMVSNHGGRSLDGAPATLSRVARVRAALGPGTPILLDGGIRSGSDVFKAIALGADAVLVGRLQAFALAVAGALGVAHMIRLLGEELEACMALAGCATLADIRAAELVPAQGPFL